MHRSAFAAAAALAFIAGFADAATFVGAGGVFCAHVTGNFVVLAADLARHARGDEWLKLATFPIFVASVLAATWFHRRLKRPSIGTLTLIQSALFGAAAIVALAAPSSSAIIVVLAVLAMGIQNANHRLTPSLGPMTTVMTGNVSQWFVEKLIPGAPENAAKHRLIGVIVIAFAVGCACGALGVAQLGFGVFFVPCIVALFARSQLAQKP